MPTKAKNRISADNVERTTVNGRTVWRVLSAKSGRVLESHYKILFRALYEENERPIRRSA